ncbi:tigger transposable element-derived protein 4-like [Ornithodoros turicata]|uniref:tigger transposable element-derived protein 4-like n=1 Tax=Ornithodoros turicata TaxID=34597 RepID=UPI0031388E88
MAPRKCLTLEQKVALIRAVEKGEKSKSVIAKEFNIPASTLSTILKNKQDVFNGFEKNFSSKIKRDRGSKYPEVEVALLEWLKNARSANLPVHGPVLIAKAEALALQLGMPDFKCSNGWLERFKKRHAVRSTPINGESGAVNQDTVDTWRRNRLVELLEVYPDRDIYNLDEAALFYKLLHKRTYTTADGSSSGAKQSKERITVLFGANATGDDKLPLLILGKAGKPRCFRGATLPKDCVYRSNKRAWMTAAIFEDYVLFIIDNCPSHGKIENLKAITVEFLPANTTSVLQPMDQGIIEMTRRLYQKSLLQRMLLAYDCNKGYSIDLLGAIHLICRSWRDLEGAKIANCFVHAGFCRVRATAQPVELDDREESESLYRRVHDLVGQEVDGYFDSFARLDTNVPVVSPVTDVEIVDIIVGHMDVDEGASEDESEGPCEIPTAARTRNMLRLIRNKVECSGGDYELMTCLRKLEERLLAGARPRDKPN